MGNITAKRNLIDITDKSIELISFLKRVEKERNEKDYKPKDLIEMGLISYMKENKYNMEVSDSTMQSLENYKRSIAKR